MHITYVHLHMHCVCGEGGTDARCTPLTSPHPPTSSYTQASMPEAVPLITRLHERTDGPASPNKKEKPSLAQFKQANEPFARKQASRRAARTHAHACTRTRPRTRTRTRKCTRARASPACERRLAWPSARMPFSSLHTGTARYQRRWRRQPRRTRRHGRHGRDGRERRLQAGGRGARGLHPHLEHPPVDERGRDARDGGDRRATAGVRP